MGDNATLDEFVTSESSEPTTIDRPDRFDNDPTEGKYNTPQYEPDGDQLKSIHAIPDNCLSFTVRAPFAHFRKVETSSTRLTYGIPPRTTVNGLVAAILGLEPNSYYELFSLTNSAIAISIGSELQELSLPIKHRNTDPDHMETVSDGELTMKMIDLPEKIPDGEAHQRVAHTMLQNVAYRIDIWLSSSDHYTTLRENLEQGKSYYTPSLGLSECLASIEYHGEYTPQPIPETESIPIDSIFPKSAGSIEAEEEMQITTEQTPAEMEQVTNDGFVRRRTTDYTAYQYCPFDTQMSVTTDFAATVDGRTVVFK